MMTEQEARKAGADRLVRSLRRQVPSERTVVERTFQGQVVKSRKPVTLRITPVAWAMPFDEIVFSRWVKHMLNQRMIMPWDDTLTTESTYISEARNTLHEQFVTVSKLDWLVMLDSDVLPPPDLVERLMATGKKMVGGWYRKKGDPYPPCVYDFVLEDDRAIAWWTVREKPGQGLEQVDGAGAGCWLMHRSVAEAVGNRPYNPDVLSEDFLLCRKLKELNIPVYIDWSINCAHTGVAIV